MKTVYGIYDKDKSCLLDVSDYTTQQEARKAMERIKIVRNARKEKCNLEVVPAKHIINHFDMYNLQCDLDRLEYFKETNDTDKVKEYLELITSHIKDIITSEE